MGQSQPFPQKTSYEKHLTSSSEMAAIAQKSVAVRGIAPLRCAQKSSLFPPSATVACWRFRAPDGAREDRGASAVPLLARTRRWIALLARELRGGIGVQLGAPPRYALRFLSRAPRRRAPRKTLQVVASGGGKIDINKQGLNSIEDDVVQQNLMGRSRYMGKKDWVDAQGRKGKVSSG